MGGRGKRAARRTATGSRDRHLGVRGSRRLPFGPPKCPKLDPRKPQKVHSLNIQEQSTLGGEGAGHFHIFRAFQFPPRLLVRPLGGNCLKVRGREPTKQCIGSEHRKRIDGPTGQRRPPHTKGHRNARIALPTLAKIRSVFMGAHFSHFRLG